MTDVHFEPFLHLVGLNHEAVLIAWGGFFFHRSSTDGTARIVDDEQLHRVSPGRNESIGARSKPYGRGQVEVRDSDGRVVARAASDDVNHAIVRGLRPDTEYTYQVRVDGQVWAEGERLDWVRPSPNQQTLRPAGRRYDNRFRTFPDPETSAPLTFATLGDFGIGILFDTDEAVRQLQIARALDRVSRERDVRLVLTVGDNIYLGPEHKVAGSGHEDDDWYFSFYQPYRYIVNRIPFYPAAGNHDSAEQEESDDRGQLEDNFFTKLRFEGASFDGEASPDSDLCYRFRFGRDIEFICVDTSLVPDTKQRFFEQPRVRAFLESMLPDAGAKPGAAPWRIPFFHHPPFCAGPEHSNMQSVIDVLVPLFERARVPVVLCGHEHNFQLNATGGITYIVAGAGGKLRTEPPTKLDQAHTQAWAVEGHFLLVEVNGTRMVITPLGEEKQGRVRPIRVRGPDGKHWPMPIVVDRSGGRAASDKRDSRSDS